MENKYIVLTKIFSYREVEELVNLKHISASSSGDGLYIYKYSKMCQFAQNWNVITLNLRGLVLDENGTIIARGFKKFFNYEELSFAEQKAWDLKIYQKQVKVFDKLDGSLGIMFVYNNELRCCTQGSFVSEQSVKALEMLSDEQKEKLKKYIISNNATVLFEIIYKENKIVLDYDFEGLVLLGAVCNNSGFEYDSDYLTELNSDFKIPEKFSIKDFKTLKSLNTKNKEGFVLVDCFGNKVKIKFEEYCILHKTMTSISTTSIWENIKMFGTVSEEILKSVPDENFNEIKKIIDGLKSDFQRISDYINDYYNGLIFSINTEDRKTFFTTLKNINLSSEIKACLSNKFLNKDYSENIWKIIKPKFRKII